MAYDSTYPMMEMVVFLNLYNDVGLLDTKGPIVVRGFAASNISEHR